MGDSYFKRVRSLTPILLFAVLCLSETLGSPVRPEGTDSEKKSYRNYKVFRTEQISSPDAVRSLLELNGVNDISFWKYPALNRSVDIMASPEKVGEVQDAMKSLGIRFEQIIEDVEALAEAELDLPFEEKAVGGMTWSRYHRYADIMNYCKSQAQRDPQVSYTAIGTSTEGREIGLVTISSGGGNDKPAIFMDGGMHAREWISPATVTYIMHKLITDSSYKDLVDTYDWHIVPIVNVDGYEHSHTSDRLWRKTRSRGAGGCIGTDPNRNWGYGWGGQGASADPCHDTYRGTRAFSEPETNAVGKAILDRSSNIKMYLTLHAYSQMWLEPWSYTHQKPADYRELHRVAQTGVQSLTATYGTRYQAGTAPDLLYAASGGSDDWAKGYCKIKYSYTLELRPDVNRGTQGFLLPASQITPTGEETLRGIAAAARAIKNTL